MILALLIVGAILSYLLIGAAVMGIMVSMCEYCRVRGTPEFEDHWGWTLLWPLIAVLAIAVVPIFYIVVFLRFICFRITKLMGAHWDEMSPLKLRSLLDDI